MSISHYKSSGTPLTFSGRTTQILELLATRCCECKKKQTQRGIGQTSQRINCYKTKQRR